MITHFSIFTMTLAYCMFTCSHLSTASWSQNKGFSHMPQFIWQSTNFNHRKYRICVLNIVKLKLLYFSLVILFCVIHDIQNTIYRKCITHRNTCWKCSINYCWNLFWNILEYFVKSVLVKIAINVTMQENILRAEKLAVEG